MQTVQNAESQVTTSGTLQTDGPRGSGFSLRGLSLAVGLTLLMFCIPPIANLFNRPDPAQWVRARTVETRPAPVISERLPDAEPSPEAVPRVAPVELPRATPSPRPAPVTPQLALAMPPLGGDVSVAFSIADMGEVAAPVFEVADVDTPPRPLRQPPPVYPVAARQMGQQGQVDLEFVVTPEGTVRDVEVLSAEPGNLFVPAAREAVLRWRFEPARHRGEAVAVRVHVPLHFTLER